jgi:hypothetical protein
MDVTIARLDCSIATGSAISVLERWRGSAADGHQSGEYREERSGGGAGQTPTACPQVLWPRTAKRAVLFWGIQGNLYNERADAEAMRSKSVPVQPLGRTSKANAGVFFRAA